jgi:hypothetical protein
MAALVAPKTYPQICQQEDTHAKSVMRHFSRYPQVLAIDATAARRHFAALLV